MKPKAIDATFNEDGDEKAATIRKMRTRAGLTLECVARHVGRSRSLLSMVERGVVPLSAELEVRLDEFFGGETRGSE